MATPRRPRTFLWSVLTVAVLVLGSTGYVLHDALAAPGRGGVTVKIAHWGRCHHLDSLANAIDGHPPTPPPGNCSAVAADRVRTTALTSAKPRPTAPPVPVVPLHAPVHTLVTPAQAGEGVFRPLVRIKGQPVIQAATMRPDAYDTGDPVGVVWMRRTALRFELHPGFDEPGGNWSVPTTIAPGRRTGLVATYNGGFKVSNGDSHGGFYLNGSYAAPLRRGAASEVFHRDGTVTVGVWGEGVSMTRDVVGVRQCLVPLVAGGRVTDAVWNGGTETWGLTDGGNSFVARSGVGVDRNGDVIYVGGRLMSVETLARTLQRAGAVTAMMLDINLSWPSFMSYDPTRHPTNPTPRNLVNFVRDADRYYDDSRRDFVAVYAR